MLSSFSNFTTGNTMPQQIEINSQFERALELINNSSRHLFITGKAGAGKSTLLNYAFKNSEKNMVIVAPTGVAALNVKGQTIHRFFSFPINTCQGFKAKKPGKGSGFCTSSGKRWV